MESPVETVINLMDETQEQTVTRRTLAESQREKYWTHVCPGIGMISQSEAVCQRCLKTKPKDKE